ncbi:pyrimidine 5'-nucleotidase [Oryzibacter oryziterrae]|uniref:pyrimidine 5'-nucleotidase n=1 Tax=Oryzibacter oryziterrae TaxID=2766474 RepID=UPI001F3D4E77|nr:pyrimidine 5'-nucleotidase [Oryzibacter oryziterrae]
MNAPSHPAVLETRPVLDFGGFAHVDFWLFDLDNTLYPAETNLFAQIDVRIRDFVARLLDMPPERANVVQKDYYHRYGTTLRGLMEEHGVTPDGFLEYVHDIDHSVVRPDPLLAAALKRLPGRKFVFTNGSRRHAERTMDYLGIGDAFDDIFDIVAADLVPKPQREAYDSFLRHTGVAPERAAMFEDLARNLAVPHAMGMRTVLVVPTGGHIQFRDAWEEGGEQSPHVDHVTEDLSLFVEGLADSRR